MKRKWITGLKIGFCMLLVAVLVCAGLGIRFGKNQLRAQLVRVRNSDFFVDVCTDFDGNRDLIRGFSVTPQEFHDFFVQNSSEFYGQRLQVAAQNRTKHDIVVLGLEVRPEDEDKFAVFVSSTPETAVAIPAGTTEPKSIWFEVLAEDLENEQTLAVLQEEYVLRIVYANADAGVTRLEDASPEQLHREWIQKFTGKPVEYKVKSHENCNHFQRTISHDMA